MGSDLQNIIYTYAGGTKKSRKRLFPRACPCEEASGRVDIVERTAEGRSELVERQLGQGEGSGVPTHGPTHLDQRSKI